MALACLRAAFRPRAFAATAGLGAVVAGTSLLVQPKRRDGGHALLHPRRFTAAARCARCDSVEPRMRFGTCKLRDGRCLAYHEEGSGTPVIALHGMGSSRLTWSSNRSIAEICPGVRLIAVDRPGYGGSSPPPFGYSYSDFARDIEELANELQLPRFAVMGHSSGGPYSLAAAALLPERVIACAAVCSDAPYSHPETPQELRAADSFNNSVLASSDGLNGQDPRTFAEGMRASALAKGNPVKAHAWKGGVDGWLCDYILERIPWSFRPEAIALGPRLTVWVGGEDIEAIKIGAPFLCHLITGSKMRVVEGGDHGFKSKPEHLTAILSELKAHSMSR